MKTTYGPITRRTAHRHHRRRGRRRRRHRPARRRDRSPTCTQAWVDWKVLFFRDQHVSVEDHIAFGRQFGELEIHPFLPNDGHPEIVVLDTASDGPSRAERWHTDVTFREAPPTGSILRGRIIPPVGGDTLWADMEAAYERLDDATKERIEHLTATHTLRINFGKRLSPEALEQKLVEYPDQHHPVVRVHPGHRPPLAVRQRRRSSRSSTTSSRTKGRGCWPG